MPSSISERQAGDPVVAFAFDHANIKIGDMRKMGAYARAIEQSFIDIGDIEGEEPEVIDAAHVDIRIGPFQADKIKILSTFVRAGEHHSEVFVPDIK
ncbi:hypothetical protein EDB19DRAFT_1989408 [Suillus lakei]|nr:hypothetical protein EDB19DRAFT_1989408 [Suillus lakei]